MHRDVLEATTLGDSSLHSISYRIELNYHQTLRIVQDLARLGFLSPVPAHFSITEKGNRYLEKLREILPSLALSASNTVKGNERRGQRRQQQKKEQQASNDANNR